MIGTDRNKGTDFAVLVEKDASNAWHDYITCGSSDGSSNVPRRFEGVFFVREALPDIPSASHRARWPTGAGRFGAFAGHLRARLGTAGKC
jgi:hypothetical protein